MFGTAGWLLASMMSLTNNNFHGGDPKSATFIRSPSIVKVWNLDVQAQYAREA